MNDDLQKVLQETSEQYQEAMNRIEQDQEQYWLSLSKEDQLKAFCAVVRRIHKAEVVDQGSYRYALYTVFGFGTEAYAQAQMAGYLELHNSIFAADHDNRLLNAFCEKFSIPDASDKIKEYFSWG